MNHIQEFNINLNKLSRFIFELEVLYNKHNNPFHNFYHCINVLHCGYLFCQKEKTNYFLDNFKQFILLLSCLCHDVEHTGHNNAFEVASQSELALTYHDISVLENHHAAVAFKLLRQDRLNILDGLENKEKTKELRKCMITNILATDMDIHFDMIARIKVKYQDKGCKYIEQIENNSKDQDDLSDIVIHCCDLIGPVMTYEVSNVWSRNLAKEFTRQVSISGVLVMFIDTIRGKT